MYDGGDRVVARNSMKVPRKADHCNGDGGGGGDGGSNGDVNGGGDRSCSAEKESSISL